MSAERIRPLRDFAVLDEDWYEDDVLVAIAEETTPMVMAYFPMLIGRCREHSHHEDNPLGWISTTVKAAARLVCDEPSGTETSDAWLAARIAMWNELRDGEIIALEGDVKSRFRLRLKRFYKYQTPKGSSTDRSRVARINAGENSSQGTPAGLAGTSGDAGGTHSESNRDRDIEVKALPSLSAKPDAERITNVFDYWVRVERETGGMGSAGKGRPPILTRDRKAKIKARLAEGYAPADLKMAIAFYSRDAWHLGDNDRGTRFTDLTTTLKNGSKVEAGMAGYAPASIRNASSPDSGAGDYTDYALRSATAPIDEVAS